ncbi:MAG: hypothetical protein IPH13_16005 [Planctomycetes bacterium]|nr:hypothetical protein [Planctomycetota bacterium]MCC7171665.1 hypothetical protein [Planctomycetota bacterium]
MSVAADPRRPARRLAVGCVVVASTIALATLALRPEFLARRVSADGSLQPYTLHWLAIYRTIALACAGALAGFGCAVFASAARLGPLIVRRGALLRKLGVATVATGLTLLGLEFALRALEFCDDVVRERHDFEAAARAFMQRVAPQLNADGFRDDPFDRPRTDGERRVLVVGDSFAFGFGIDERARTFPAALEAELSVTHSVDVFNAGVPGADTRRELDVLASTLDRVDPDLVLLAWYVNDAESNERKQEYVQQSRLVPLVSDVLLRYSALWRRLEPALVALCVRSGAKASYLEHLRRLYDAPSGAGWTQREEFQAFLARAKGDERKVAVLLFPLVEDFDAYPMTEVHALIRATCVEASVPCFDVLDALRHESASTLQTSALDHHLNATGCALAARAVSAFILRDALLRPSTAAR